jgi:hypothetical protein
MVMAGWEMMKIGWIVTGTFRTCYTVTVIARCTVSVLGTAAEHILHITKPAQEIYTFLLLQQDVPFSTDITDITKSLCIRQVCTLMFGHGMLCSKALVTVLTLMWSLTVR